MKRILSALLCLVLAVTTACVAAAAADTGGFVAGNLQRVTLYPGSLYENESDVPDFNPSSSGEVLDRTAQFLASAGKKVSRPADARTLASIYVEGSGGNDATYLLLKSGSGYYLSLDSACRPVKYDDFEQLVKAADGVYGTVSSLHPEAEQKFYVFAPLPGASWRNKELAIPEHSYSYKRVNGQFVSRNTTITTEAPTFSSADGKLVIPDFYRTPESAVYTVYGDGGSEALWSGGSAQAAVQKLDPGRYTVWIQASYNHDLYRGSVTYLYNLSVTGSGKPIEISAVADHAQPGEVVVLKVTGPDASKALATAASDVGFTPTFYRQDPTTQIALLPVSVYTAPGSHYVDVKCGEHSARVTFNAREKKFEVQHLTVEASTAEETILSQKANQEYERVIGPLRTVADSRQYWSGRFLLPTSDEKVTSSFGVIRYVNGSSTATRHNALDFAVPKGTPVKAAGAGRVLYAGFLQLTGNTILIEHGYGLKSWYYHMDSLNVKTNDMVTQGQQIGAVGSTGFSTGAHMHFGMSVNNVFINPYTLIKTDLLADIQAPGVTLKLEKSSYPISTKTIKGTVTNNTTRESGYGNAYRIDRWDGGAWKTVPLEIEVTEEAAILRAGQSGTVSFNLYQSQYAYKAGKYRVVMTDGAGGASAEFNLT